MSDRNMSATETTWIALLRDPAGCVLCERVFLDVVFALIANRIYM